MKLYTHGFWEGFIDKTNPINIIFFQDLFKTVFDTNIELCDSILESDILLETVFTHDTKLFNKQWKYSFLFSGESRLNKFAKYYSCILWGERNNNNIVNVPLFIPYLYCNNFLEQLYHCPLSNRIPTKNICAIISNSSGTDRNTFLNALDQRMHVDYAGEYKSNVPKIVAPYYTEEFRNAISEYKFIISMENSRGDTYITEKITHGLLTNTIPVYWGSSNIQNYFNINRFINVESIDEQSIDKIIDKIEYICNNDDEYIKIINQTIFKNNKNSRQLFDISRDIKNVIFSKKYSSIDQIYIISNPEFEPERYERLNILFKQCLQVPDCNIKFICPTYKQTITDEIMNQSVKQQLVQRLRNAPMKKAEVSLFYNYKAVLEDIQSNYKDGIFMIFESDVFATNNILNIEDFLNFIKNKKELWDLIHIGGGGETQIYECPYIYDITPYRDAIRNKQYNTYIEDITTCNDFIRMIRKYHTRCTDSFVWNYSGIIKFLNHMNTDLNYGAPLDYYMINKFELDDNFKHYWTNKTYFIQGSNNGLDVSTIQND